MILERDDELRSLDDAIVHVRSGDGSLVIVEGDPGIGKTTILRAAWDRAAAAGVRVLRTTCSELEQHYAYGVAIGLFETLLRDMSSTTDTLFEGVAGAARSLLTPHSEPADRSADPFARTLGLYWLALNVADHGPVLMVIDDAQWADGASLRFVDYLSRHLDGTRIGLMLAFRNDVTAADEQAAQELRVHATIRLRPRPLSESAVGKLLAALGENGSDAELRRACWRMSGGNPFFVTELIDTLRPGSVDEDGPVTPDVVGALVPGRILRQVEGRVARLDSTARRVAEAFALLDEAATIGRVAVIAGTSESQTLEVADRLARSAILARSGSTTFTHPMVREAIYRLMPEANRSHLHRRAGLLLHREGAPLGVAAGHLLVAEHGGDDEVVTTLTDAAREARGRGDAAVAARYLRRALREPAAPSRRAYVLIELARAEAALAAPSAVDHFREAIDLVEDRLIKAELLFEQGGAQVNASDWPGAVATFERGLGLGLDGAPNLRARLEVATLAAAWLGTDRRVEQLRRFEAVLESRPLGPEDRELALWITWHRAATGVATATDVMAEVRRLLESTPIDELATGGPSIEAIAQTLLATDGLTEALDILSRGLAAARTSLSFRQVGVLSYFRAWPDYFTGDLPSAIADAQTALRIAEFGWEAFHPSTCAVLILALIERGELAAADAISALEGPGWAGRLDTDMMIPIARGRLHLERGQLDAAVAELGRSRDTCAAIGRRLQIPMDWRTWMVEALVRSGSRDEARDVARELLAIAETWGAEWPLGVAMRAAGIAEGGTEGIELLRRAVTILETTPARLESARALVSLGAALRRRGSLKDARATLARALDLSHRCGAFGLAERAREELTASGSRPRRHVLQGAESLTPAERRVAELAADGRTNREVAQILFVTPKAVEYHLANAYRKLEIGSRRELATALHPIPLGSPVVDRSTTLNW